MGVDRPKLDRFSSDKRIADGSVRIMIDHCLANLAAIQKLRGGPGHVQAVKDFAATVGRGEELTPRQRRYLENLYEKSFAANGFESIGTHVDRKRKSLRFG